MVRVVSLGCGFHHVQCCFFNRGSCVRFPPCVGEFCSSCFVFCLCRPCVCDSLNRVAEVYQVVNGLRIGISRWYLWVSCLPRVTRARLERVVVVGFLSLPFGSPFRSSSVVSSSSQCLVYTGCCRTIGEMLGSCFDISRPYACLSGGH